MDGTENYRSRLQDEQRARSYADRFERGARRRIGQREQAAVREIFGGWAECRSVLDLPCGAGRFAMVLSAPGRDVLGMDVSEDVLAHAVRRAADLGLAVRYLPGDATCIPLPDQSVDVVFCNRLLHHMKNAQERGVFLREFRRVSRLCLVVSFFDYHRFGRIRAWLKRLKGRRVNYAGKPTLAEFESEAVRCGFRLRAVVPTGPVWTAEKYLVLETSS
jgi:SAM-dependent methyltransferase